MRKVEAAIVLALLAFCPRLAAGLESSAQQPDTTNCCTVVRVDVRRGIVTARETATGYTFSVEVKNRKHLAALKVGNKVWANFAAKKVRLESAGDSLCCVILKTPPDGPSASLHPHSAGAKP